MTGALRIYIINSKSKKKKYKIFHVQLDFSWDIHVEKFMCRCPEEILKYELQFSWLNKDWISITTQTQFHMNLLEPLVAFRRVLLQILGCEQCTMQHLLQSASLLRKVCMKSYHFTCSKMPARNTLSCCFQGSKFSHAAASLHEFKFLCAKSDGGQSVPDWLGRVHFNFPCFV